MTVIDSPLASKISFTYNLSFGNFYFCDNILITEIFEGVIVGKEEFIEISDLLVKHIDIKKPYGLISHRLYSYSVNLYELIPLIGLFGLLVVNAIVAYSGISFKNFELEKRLLKFEGESFNNLKDAFEWTKLEVENISKSYEA